MFRPIDDIALTATLDFTFDGRPLKGRAGDTVAGALLANGISLCRETPISGAPRGPYCMMGCCFDCLVVIDGVGNRQCCLVPLSAGMQIKTQHGRRELVGRP